MLLCRLPTSATSPEIYRIRSFFRSSEALDGAVMYKSIRIIPEAGTKTRIPNNVSWILYIYVHTYINKHLINFVKALIAV